MATTTESKRVGAAAERRRESDLEKHKNADAITGEPGSHPIGAGLGSAVGGAAAGVGAGALGGPIGAAVGAVVGGVVGGLAGKEIAEEIDPTVEEHYWRHEYVNRDYYNDDVAYSQVKPAYRHGWEARCRHFGRTWEEAEADVRREWESSDHGKAMRWERARQPIHDAWDRVECIFAKGD
jgi:phage tail tape-measure protein